MAKLKKKILSIVGLISILGIMSIMGLAMGCVSAADLSIEISSPQDGATVSESSVTFTCTASGYSRGQAVVGEQTVRIIPEVTVNGIEAKVAENGSFSAQVELTEGENTIEAVALLDTVEVRDSITVTYTLAAPALSVEIIVPEDGTELNGSPVAIIGTVSDNASAVTVNGVAAVVAADGSFSAQIELAEGENVITAVATLGELHTADSITVTYTQVAPALSVEIIVPEDGAELNESPVAIIGTVSDNTSAVTVNGVAATVAADGSFAAQIELAEGENVITAVAILGALQTADSITVTHTPS